MIEIIHSPAELDFEQIMFVCRESFQTAGMQNYPTYSAFEQQSLAQQDYYDYLLDMLRDRQAFCAAWKIEEKYCTVLRAEPYRDGMLIAGIETAPQSRGKGYATQLLLGVISYLSVRGIKEVYSHIQKDNIPSMRVHQKCGFEKISDRATFLDGSVYSNYFTFSRSI